MGKKKLIYVVEDNKELATLLAELLEEQGYAVKQAYNGGEALKLLEKELPDLMLLDIMMPGIDGSEVLLKMKSQPETAHVPVIICTALNEMKDVERFFKWGAAGYITKPFEHKRIVDKVKQTLGDLDTSS